jgi:UDP-glucose 4-epimerase
MTNVLVSGGAGFIGSHIIEALLNCDGYKDVVAIDNLSGGFECNVPSGAVAYVHPMNDLSNHRQLEELFKQYKFDYVFHFAAYAAEGLSHFIRRFNYQNNLINSVNLINLAIKYDVKCFVYASSAAVYGHSDKYVSEIGPTTPADPYGIAKLAVEMDLRTAQEMFGLNYIIYRMHNVYGERQNLMDRYRNVIGIFMRQVLHDEPITIFGDGSQTRQFTYVGDIVPIIANSIYERQCYNQVYNIGSKAEHTITELANRIIAVAKKDKYPIKFLPSRNEVKNVRLLHDKLEITHATPLTFGLVQMYKWAKTVELKEADYFHDIEISKNLPPTWEKR